MLTQSQKDVQRQKSTMKDKNEELQKIIADLQDAERDYRKKFKELELMKRKKNTVTDQRDQNNLTKNFLKEDFDRLSEAYDAKKKEVELLKKDIENKMRERDLLNKDVVEAEEKKIQQAHLRQTLENDQVKLRNKLQSFKAEADRLQQTINTLEHEKEKYGIEASQANAKYYQSLEQVKLKNNLISKLQKKNIEVENRLK